MRRHRWASNAATFANDIGGRPGEIRAFLLNKPILRWVFCNLVPPGNLNFRRHKIHYRKLQVLIPNAEPLRALRTRRRQREKRIFDLKFSSIPVALDRIAFTYFAPFAIKTLSTKNTKSAKEDRIIPQWAFSEFSVSSAVNSALFREGAFQASAGAFSSTGLP